MKIGRYKVLFWVICGTTGLGILILLWLGWGVAQLGEPDLTLIQSIRVPHFVISCYRAQFILSYPITQVKATEEGILWNTERLILQESLENVDELLVKTIGEDSCYIFLRDSGLTKAAYRVSLRHELQLYADTNLEQQICVFHVMDSFVTSDPRRATGVDLVAEAGSYFANIASLRDSARIWARRVIGHHTKSGIDYRLLDSACSVFEGDSRISFLHAEAADSLWEFMGEPPLVHDSAHLQAIFDRAGLPSSSSKDPKTHSVTWRELR